MFHKVIGYREIRLETVEIMLAPAHQQRHINTASVLEFQLSALFPCSTGKVCLQDMLTVKQISGGLKLSSSFQQSAAWKYLLFGNKVKSLLCVDLLKWSLQLPADASVRPQEALVTEGPQTHHQESSPGQRLRHCPLPLLLSKTIRWPPGPKENREVPDVHHKATDFNLYSHSSSRC